MSWRTILEVFQSVDRSLVDAYRTGLGMGVIILSTLIVFPGRGNVDDEEEVALSEAKDQDMPRKGKDPSAEVSSRNVDQTKKPRQSTNIGPSKEEGWNPHRKLNLVVYLIIFGFVITILTCSYTDRGTNPGPMKLITLMFRTYFPKEAALFSLQDKK